MQAFLCAGIEQTLKRAVALAFQHAVLDEDHLSCDLPLDSVFPAQYDATESYMKETMRVLFEYAGITLCGMLMPMIELRKDRDFVNRAIQRITFVLFPPGIDWRCRVYRSLKNGPGVDAAPASRRSRGDVAPVAGSVWRAQDSHGGQAG